MATKVEEQEQQEPDGVQVPIVTESPEGSGPAPAGEASPPAKQDSHSTPTKVFTQEDIERVRKEEKDKLYKSIEDMKSQLALVTKEREDREKAAKDAEKAAAAAAKAKDEEEKSAKELLSQKEQEWEQRFQQIEASRERSEALLEQERRYAVIQDYRSQRLQAEAENIMPELLDYVQGMSEDEIEQSIVSAKEKTARIVGNIQAATQQQRQQQRGTSVTSPPVGPMEQNNEGYETLSAEDIRSMPMSEYSKRRDSLIKAASNNRNKGLFG